MAEIKDPENTILIELKGGTVTIALLPDVAPKHVERMKALAAKYLASREPLEIAIVPEGTQVP